VRCVDDRENHEFIAAVLAINTSAINTKRKSIQGENKAPGPCKRSLNMLVLSVKWKWDN
jgi:hypothetical protein